MNPAQHFLKSRIAIGVSLAVSGVGARLLQAWGLTTAGVGRAVVVFEGSNNKGDSWDVLGIITLTLGTVMVSGAIDLGADHDGYALVRAKVRDITGTGATVSACMNGPRQLTADYTLSDVDNGQMLTSIAGAPIAITVPKDLSGGFSVAGFQSSAAGKMTFGAAAGVTVRNKDTQFATNGQDSMVALANVGPELYVFTGQTGV